MTKRPTKKPKTGSPKKVAASLRPLPALAPDLARAVAPLVERVVAILDEARSRVVRTVNSTMVLVYWHVGREIVEFVQRGAKRAEYGEQVLEELSAHLRARIGRGYSTTNLRYFRTFYLAFRDRVPEIRHIGGGESWRQAQGIAQGIRHKRSGVSGAAPSVPSLDGFSPVLGWSHYRALMNVEHEAERAFLRDRGRAQRVARRRRAPPRRRRARSSARSKDGARSRWRAMNETSLSTNAVGASGFEPPSRAATWRSETATSHDLKWLPGRLIPAHPGWSLPFPTFWATVASR